MATDKRPLAFWMTAIQYLHLVEVVSEETVKQGNCWAVVSSEEVSWEEYAQRTKWSDFEIAVPILFNFYHGIELLLKGFILAKGELRQVHKISELYKRFCEIFPDNPVVELLKPYIRKIDPSSILGGFLSSNGISIDEYYQALKYPTSTKGAKYFHRPLQFNTDVGLKYFHELNQCVLKLREETLLLGRSLDPDA